MQGKPMLAMYRARKREVKRKLLFDNLRGSSLFFEARMVVLRTKTYRAEFEEVDLLCIACKTDIETSEHIVLMSQNSVLPREREPRCIQRGLLDFLGKTGK